MVLYLIGIGLHDEKDITIKGLEIVKKCNKIYLENYTSQLNAPLEDLEKFYGKKILPADRKFVEETDYNVKCIKAPSGQLTSTILHIYSIKINE